MSAVSNPMLIVQAISTVLTHMQGVDRHLLRTEALRFLQLVIEMRTAKTFPKHVIRRYHITSERIVAGIQASQLKESYVSLMAATQSLEHDLVLLEQMKNQSGTEEDNFFACW